MKKAMKVVLIVSMLVSLSACKRSASTPPASVPTSNQATTTPSDATSAAQPAANAKTAGSNRPRVDACALLTNAEIAAVQKDTVTGTKLSGAPDGGFDISQCFFTLQSFANSVSLKVTQKREGDGARDPREFWRDAFHESERDQGDDRDRERARKKAREKLDREDEEKESAPPLRVNGVGDEAFWMGDQVGGALYVLKGNNYLRISVGGAGDRNAKIKKSTELAQKALGRLT